MNLIDKIVYFVRSKLYYEQPVYIPGYRYNTWRKWAVIAIVTTVFVFLATNVFHHFGLLGNFGEDVSPESMQSTSNSENATPVSGAEALKGADTSHLSYPSENSLQENCDSNYSPCIPVSSTDLDCGDIGFSVRVLGSDSHRLDGDGDGYGCESY